MDSASFDPLFNSINFLMLIFGQTPYSIRFYSSLLFMSHYFPLSKALEYSDYGLPIVWATLLQIFFFPRLKAYFVFNSPLFSSIDLHGSYGVGHKWPDVTLKMESIKSNQIKSNQIKSNQIKSNQIVALMSGLACCLLREGT